MNNIIEFQNNDFAVRTTVINEEPWFVGKDVAEALGYKNSRDALSKHVEDCDKADVAIHDGRQNRQMTVINESGMYALIFGSKLDKAKEFKHWVTSEVLPSIRKNGGYIADQTTLSPDELMAKALMVAQSTLIEREKRLDEQSKTIKTLEPKAKAFDQLLNTDSLLNFREAAKMLGMKQNTFIGWLEDHKYIYRDQRGKIQPYSNKMQYFTIKQWTHGTKSGTQTLITQRGISRFRELLESEKL